MVLHFYSKNKRRLKLLLVLGWALSIFSFQLSAAMPQSRFVSLKLGDFIRSLEKQYNVTFVYDATQLSKEGLIQADANVSPLVKAVQQLNANGISYKIIGDKIILKKEVKIVQAIQQDILVKGAVQVKSKAGWEPGPGIHVHEKELRMPLLPELAENLLFV